MRIPEHKVDEILRAADLVEVIQDYVQLKKRGSNYVGLSPFKPEKSPSFVVSPSKGIFKDFSSGKGGSAITFLMELEGYTYPEALMHLAKKYNIEVVVSEDPGYKDQESRKASMYILNSFAAEYFQQQLHTTDEGKLVGLSYFKERGLTDDIIQKFQLGYSPEAWDALTKHALASKYKEELLLHLGLSIKSEQNDRIFDRFRGRVIFPIHNPNGKISGFGGRILQQDAKAAKYVNSPESEIYHKGDILYGLYFAREDIRKAGQVMLVEGYLDVISMHQFGVSNVVAASGTALSEYQVKLLSRHAKKVILVNDADSAGINASLRALDILLAKEMEVEVLLLPEGDDPDSFIRREGSNVFKDYVAKHKQDFLAFKIGSVPDAMVRPDLKAAMVDSIAATLAHIPNSTLMQAWIQETAKRLSFPEQTIMSAVNRELIRMGKEAAQAQARQEAKAGGGESSEVPVAPAYAYNPFDSAVQERELLRLMLNHFDSELAYENPNKKDEIVKTPLLYYLFTELSSLTFTHPLYERVKSDLFQKVKLHQPIVIQEFVDHADPEVAYLVSDLLTVRNEISENWQRVEPNVPVYDGDLLKAVDSALHHFLSYHLDRLKRQIEQQLQTAVESKSGEAEIDRLMKQYQILKQSDHIHSKRIGTVIKRI
jgi:DNA primase